MKYLLTLLLSCSFFFIFSQTNLGFNFTDLEPIQDIDKKTYELLYKKNWFESDSLVKASIYKPKDQIDKLSDQQLINMIEMIPTSFPLNYNQIVRQHIEQFTVNRRLLISQSLGLGTYYFPIFEQKLSEFGLPDVLKYLPIIESNLNPFAKSGAGALGIWQFMPGTGKSLGLIQNDYYDARRDIHLSTHAAAKYLSDLYKIYGDWLLTLAAYNAGPGNVNKAIGLAGGKKSYWEIRPFLPQETRDYIPKFTACVFAMEYHKLYDILPQKPKSDFFTTDTVIVYNKLSLKYISEVVGIDSAYLRFINPALKAGIIPKTEKGYALNIPLNFLGQYYAMSDLLQKDPYIQNIEAVVADEIKVAPKPVAPAPKYTTYKVKSGDTLSHIGSKYGVGVSEIKNGIL
jgi:membrane-bound lytic murein transglycosylase D